MSSATGPTSRYPAATTAGPASPDSAIASRGAPTQRAVAATAKPKTAATTTMRLGPNHHSSGPIRPGASSTPRRGVIVGSSVATATAADASAKIQTPATVTAALAAIGAATSESSEMTEPTAMPMTAASASTLRSALAYVPRVGSQTRANAAHEPSAANNVALTRLAPAAMPRAV